MIQQLSSYGDEPSQGVSNCYENEKKDDLVSPLLWGCFGVRNSGKSHLISKYVISSQKRKRPLYDRLFLVTPSFKSNESYWAPYITTADVKPPTDTALQEIIEECEQEAKDWQEHVELLEEYKDVINALKRGDELTDEQLITSIKYGWLDWAGYNLPPPPPEWKYHKKGHEDRPAQCILIMDDCLAQPQMLSSPTLTKLGALNRHVAGLETPFVSKHGNVRTSIGLSVIFLSQSYRCQGGPGRILRENMTHATVFKNKQPKQFQSICEELGSSVDEERFKKAYEIATRDKYGCVTVDFKPVRDELQFRKGLNAAIIL